MKKIAFFGGSFNPPSFAHLEIARLTMQNKLADEFYFVPVGNTYKKPGLIDEKYRLEMLKIMCRDEKNIAVDDIELNKEEKITAIQAFEMIEKKHNPNNDKEIFFVMGEDNFLKLPKWENSEKMIEKYKFIIFGSDKKKIEKFIKENENIKKLKRNFNVIELQENKLLRSSIIRNQIKQGKYKEVENNTKKGVIDYIIANSLYEI